MYLEIVSPEAVLFSSEVDSVIVPGLNGEFQMLNNHAPIVSLLTKGIVKIHTQGNSALDNLHESIEILSSDKNTLTVNIKSGTLEMKDNKAIILAD